MDFSQCSLKSSSLSEVGMESVTTKRILVIEDEANLRILVKICLEMLAKWEVIQAVSGHEGLFLAEKEKPDAILLDVMMPGMDGITFLQELLNNPKIQAIPVVFLTAEMDVIKPECFLKLGAKGAIAKPFEPITLHDQVASFLGWDSD